MLNFSHECTAIDAQSQSWHQKLLTILIKCSGSFIWKQNGGLAYNLMYLRTGIFPNQIQALFFGGFIFMKK